MQDAQRILIFGKTYPELRSISLLPPASPFPEPVHLVHTGPEQESLS
jgi:hypothetical protein